MRPQTNLSDLLEEFSYKYERKICCLTKFNNHYWPNSYKKHLKKRLADFKHDMFYELPFNQNANKAIYIKNIHSELSKKKRKLVYHLFDKKMNGYCNKHKWIYATKISQALKLENLSCRRMIHLHYIQLRYINLALYIIKRSAENYSVELEPNNTEVNINKKAVWDGGYLEFRQLCIALIHSNKLKINDSQKETINRMAQLLGLKVPKNADSSLSHAIHDRNMDYEPRIFNDIKKAYKSYETIMRDKVQERQ
jgi:hypothetical protein